jgi:hypothetical protein
MQGNERWQQRDFSYATAMDTRSGFQHLFDALKGIASGETRNCQNCGSKMHLRLTYAFGLEAGPHEGKVLDVFLPEEIAEWPNKSGGVVRFYPFLVMVESASEGYTSAWLPYWHVVTRKDGAVERKFGQWAPFMGEDALASLVNQARVNGYKI